MEKRTIVLATYGKTKEHAHSECIEALRYQLDVQVFDTKGNAHIDMARSLLATTALAHGADVVLFVDHDIVFNPLDVEPLANIARETKGIVGGAYSTRKLGGPIVCGLDPACHKGITFFEGGGLYEATGVMGMGFTAIHREVFEKFDALPQYTEVNSSEGILRPYFQKIVADGYWLHEDASFCHVARSLKISTMVDTRIRLKHVGEHAFGLEECRVRVPEQTSMKG